MRAVIHYHPDLDHQRLHAEAMRNGLERQGVECAFGGYDAPSARTPDFAVVWGAPHKQPNVRASVEHVLVMERGHLPDRMKYASLGWDGLGRHARYPTAPVGSSRWARLWGKLMQPWHTGGYALLIGQVPNDAALNGLTEGWNAFASGVANALHRLGWPVHYRAHPMVGSGWCPFDAVRAEGTLQEALSRAGLCVTYNSTAGVEAVLAGVPTVTLEEGAMAWPVSSHQITEALTPDRTRWAQDLAFTSWSLEEIAAGLPWQHLAPLLEEAPCPSN